MIGRRLRPAAIDERTRIGTLAVRANRNVGRDRQTRRNHLQPHFFSNGGEPSFDHLADIDTREEIGEIGIHALSIEVHDLAAHDRHSGSAQHVRLDGNVGNVLQLAHRRLRLYLDQSEATVDALEDVGEDQRVVGDDGRFVNRRDGLIVHCFLAFGQNRIEAAAAALDQPTARHVGAGDHANTRALLHPEPRGDGGAHFRRGGIVHLPPHALQTLRAGEKCFLGESVVTDHGVQGRNASESEQQRSAG